MKEINIQNVTFSYGKNNPIFKDISLNLKAQRETGYVYGVMGSSGSGKSTFLKLMMKIINPVHGNITFTEDTPVIAYVPQEPVLFEHLSISDNARFFQRVHNYRDLFDESLYERMSSILGLEDILDSSNTMLELSGGQKQRISLLRALSINPDYLFLDEPLTGLDEELKNNFIYSLLEIINVNKLLVVYVTHHNSEIMSLADEVIYLLKDSKDKCVNKIFISPIKQFIETPPSIAASNAIKGPETTSWLIKLGKDNQVEPLEQSLLSNTDLCYYITFASDCIRFSNDFGFDFDLVGHGGMFSVLRLKNSNIIVAIPTNNPFFNNQSGHNKIYLDGKCLLYNKDGVFFKELTIKDNYISI